MDNLLYWSGHRAFGDSFCICAAAHIKSREINQKVLVSFWEPFKHLASYFENVIWIPEADKSKYNIIDCGIDPGCSSYLFNGVSRFLIHMKPNSMKYTDIQMNISKNTNTKNISVVVSGSVNGDIQHSTLKSMLARAKIFYPDHQLMFIGHKNNNISNYKDLQIKYNIVDNRMDETTGCTVIDHIKNSSLMIAPHTGLVFPAIGLGLDVWCEESKNPIHNFLLNFPKNRPFFFSKNISYC